MIIGGLQKLTLIDYPGKVSAVVFTQGCQFRCAYCHNPELLEMKREGGLSEEEVLAYIDSKKHMLDGVCVTGGEPTLQGDLPVFLEKIKKLGLAVKLDTNGSNPAMVRECISRGLVDYLAMDLKHPWSRYQDVVQSRNATALANCKKTFEMIQSSGVDHEFRTTVFPQMQSEEDIFEIARSLPPGEKYFLQRICYEKNLDPALDRSKVIDVPRLVLRLQEEFPRLCIGFR